MKENQSYYQQKRPEMLAKVPKDTTSILDVGCGAGSFGIGVREKMPNCRLYGVEIYHEQAAHAMTVYDHVWVGDVNEVLRGPSLGKYDLIVFNDILEHLPDPSIPLKACLELISENGLILASIPNMRFWPAFSDLIFQGDWRYKDAGVMDTTHLRFFTKKSMIRLFNDCGYRVVSIEGINKTWITSWRWRVMNAVLLGTLGDCLFPQFAVTAKPSFRS